MSPSLLNAGRTTHLKIVAVALVAGIAVVAVGINARTTNQVVRHGVWLGSPTAPAFTLVNEQCRQDNPVIKMMGTAPVRAEAELQVKPLFPDIRLSDGHGVSCSFSRSRNASAE